MPEWSDLEKVALVVGGVRGIGLAAGDKLAEAGWRVVLADRDGPDDPAVTDRFACRVVDVTDSASVNALVAGVVQDFGRLNGVVNAAGYNRHGTVAEIEDCVWQDLFEVHLGGVLRVCRAAHSALGRAGGAVVNIASIGARVGRPRRAPYAAAKAGVEAITRTLAVEWAPQNIRVNAILPGIIDTRLVRENIAAGRVSEASLTGFVPLRRMGQASEIADAIEFLISSRASYITGQSLVVDGGALANGDW